MPQMRCSDVGALEGQGLRSPAAILNLNMGTVLIQSPKVIAHVACSYQEHLGCSVGAHSMAEAQRRLDRCMVVSQPLSSPATPDVWLS